MEDVQFFKHIFHHRNNLEWHLNLNHKHLLWNHIYNGLTLSARGPSLYARI